MSFDTSLYEHFAVTSVRLQHPTFKATPNAYGSKCLFSLFNVVVTIATAAISSVPKSPMRDASPPVESPGIIL